jgi:hypothetical protein
MTNATTSDILTVISALLAFLAHWLQSDGLPRGVNIGIAAGATVLLAAIVAWETGFTGDIQHDLLQILTSWLIFVYQLVMLFQEARKAQSPLVEKEEATS